MIGKHVKMRKFAQICMVLAAFMLLDAVESRTRAADAGGFPQEIDLYDVILKYPQPAWISGEVEPTKLLDQSEFYRDHAGSQFILEQIPKGQNFESWSSLFAVAAEELGVGKTASMREFIGLAVEQNSLACAEGGFGVQTLSVTEANALLAMVCGSTADGPPNVGYGADVGEVSIWRFLIFEDTFVKVFQRWRGASFEADDRANWPVSEPQMQEMLRRMADGIAIQPNNLRR
ncbi:MAG: hypothetical protein HOK98_00855 [Rhodospirillaceae bacterium]|jgi:hypothetical protein|nr:hypothetical protein [Rhodospirillaceae bacterium]MBT6404831.1 hypothetical protein [Rhodospirillaceae bacterium]MBT6534702.1 hypothetical protein [Rhodospirillaceae bacterium]MBT7363083.1 hypothetical protein [Rhodospirillaceae bacterium]